jgi:hypothetical protein
MIDPDDDPNAIYDVVLKPFMGRLESWAVTGNGIPVRHFTKREDAERYATVENPWIDS